VRYTELIDTGTPAPSACNVIELRQYTLHPLQRDVLIELFDREFVEPQEAAGICVMGQFHDLDDPDRFIWLRGFVDMNSRDHALQSFYGGPVWAAHRDVANATMIDSDNVLLLRPAWAGAGDSVLAGQRAAPGARLSPGGLVQVSIHYLKGPATPELLTLCRERMATTLERGGAKHLAWYQTEDSANSFPRLPVRAGEHVLVGLAVFDDTRGFDAFQADGSWQRNIEPLLSGWLSRASEFHRLIPTARSKIHGTRSVHWETS
jgi:hypothetical protein